MSVRMDSSETQEYFEKILQREAKKITIPGFRKGKAPISIVKKIHGESLKIGNLDKVVTEKFWKEVEKQDLNVISTPVITHVDIDDNDNIDFKIKYETYPEIELNDCNGFGIEKIVYEISENSIDEEIKKILFSKRTTAPADTIDNKEVIVDLEITKLDSTGLPLIGEKNEPTKLYLNSPDANQSLVESLLSKKKDDEFVFTHMPQHHHHKNEKVDHDHLPEKYSVKVKNIEKVILPEFTDSFCQETSKGDYKNVEEFKIRLKENLQKNYDNFSRRIFENGLMDELIRRNDFNPPNTFVDKTLDSYIEEEKEKYPNKKFPADVNIEELRESKRPDAIWGVKWMILRDKLLEKENLMVTDEELERIAEEESKKTGITKDKMKNYLKNSNHFISNLKTNKALKYLEEKAEIKIKSRIV